MPVPYVIRVSWLMTSKVTDFTYGLSLRGPYVSALRGHFRAICSACLFSVTVTIIVYRHSHGKRPSMKDAHDNQTPDLLPVKRPRGRPRTGKAMTQAERQAKYRAKVAENNVTVTVNRGLLERLDAQMQAIRDGNSAQILTPDEAGQVLEALRRAHMVQLKGQGR